ncbi:MAG: Jag N-terminal domain-containing protein [Actinobacteria bacterium]|jgi:spoIIIJ-associated protein|nr:Jag N-terminal domain-containing protein [Actinomycetota bacterium]
MEWVEVSGRTIEEAKLIALEKLGVLEEDAEFVVLSEPKSGLFGWRRGEARIRARVKPVVPRPKYRRANHRHESNKYRSQRAKDRNNNHHDLDKRVTETDDSTQTSINSYNVDLEKEGENMDNLDGAATELNESTVVSDFLLGLTKCLGIPVTVDVTTSSEGNEVFANINGTDLGILIGHGGVTLAAIEELTRTVAQRHIGHSSRINVDVAGYRVKRRDALERLARDTAEQVIETGIEHVLEPMLVADRKIIHDTVNGITGVATRSEGRDPKRRVVIYRSDD